MGWGSVKESVSPLGSLQHPSSTWLFHRCSCLFRVKVNARAIVSCNFLQRYHGFRYTLTVDPNRSSYFCLVRSRTIREKTCSHRPRSGMAQPICIGSCCSSLCPSPATLLAAAIPSTKVLCPRSIRTMNATWAFCCIKLAEGNWKLTVGKMFG